MSKELKINLNWSGVERSLAEGTFSGYKIGILETEKLLGILFDQKKIPGKKIEAKIKYISRFLSQPQKLNYSRQMMQRVLEEPNFEISREETKQVISGYWQAMLDLEEAVNALSFWQKIGLKIKYFISLFLSKIKKALVFLLALSLVIWLLGETSIGQKFTKALVKINHFFIFKIIFWGAIVLAGAFIITIFLLWLLRGRKRM